MLEIGKETVAGHELKHGWVDVGNAPSQLTELEFRATKGILVTAPISNTAVVYLGSKRVTADQTSTGGTPLAPGMSLGLPVDDPSTVYVITASEDSQSVSWLCV